MSLLDKLKQATSAGISTLIPRNGRSKYSSTAQARGLQSTADLAKKATTGYAFGPEIPTKKGPQGSVLNDESVLLGSLDQSYLTSTFNDQLKKKNKLVDNTAKTYAFRPTNFQQDIATYTDRIFMQQRLGADQYAKTPASLINPIAISKPVLTTYVPPNVNTPPTGDGRYTITVGYGFVLYGTLTNGGYA